MSSIRTLAHSFSGGEVTSEFWARIDDPKFQTGLALCENTEIVPHGPVRNRVGSKYVCPVKDSTKRTKLIPFIYSSTQAFSIEVGEKYFRFHTGGATLLVGDAASPYNAATSYDVGGLAAHNGVNYYCIAPTTGNAPPNATYWHAMPASGAYEVPTPYLEADLYDDDGVFNLHYVQSNDVLTLVHPKYPSCELRREGGTKWVLKDIDFVPDIQPPTGLSAVQEGSTTTETDYSYKVTSVGDQGAEESQASAAVTVQNENTLSLTVTNNISWSAQSAATLYNVYKKSNGLYGYIGQTDETSFKDDNIVADVSKTPPIADDPFTGEGNYPAAVSYFEQRRSFAGTINEPHNFRTTKAGTESNMCYSLPQRDTDAINVRVAAREANTIRHIVPLSNLLILTSSAEWRVLPLDTDVITAKSISVRPQSFIGASNVQPIIVNTNMIYGAARGGHLRELAYSWQANGYQTGDISLRAPHLFDGYQVLDLTHSKSPFPIVWSASSSGMLIGCTYIPEQQIGSLHRHTTRTLAGESAIESACAIPEGDTDAVYLVVRREINGQQVRYIECFGKRDVSELKKSFFVDCGATYEGEATDTISGLDWLEGETVSILADGAVHPQLTVQGGAIKLDNPASLIHVGLPVRSRIKLLPAYFQTQGFGQGRRKSVTKAFLRVEESSGIRAGASFDPKQMTRHKQGTNPNPSLPPELISGEIEINVTGKWGDEGALCIEQSDPLPLTVVSISLEMSVS